MSEPNHVGDELFDTTTSDNEGGEDAAQTSDDHELTLDTQEDEGNESKEERGQDAKAQQHIKGQVKAWLSRYKGGEKLPESVQYLKPYLDAEIDKEKSLSADNHESIDDVVERKLSEKMRKERKSELVNSLNKILSREQKIAFQERFNKLVNAGAKDLETIENLIELMGIKLTQNDMSGARDGMSLPRTMPVGNYSQDINPDDENLDTLPKRLMQIPEKDRMEAYKRILR